MKRRSHGRYEQARTHLLRRLGDGGSSNPRGRRPPRCEQRPRALVAFVWQATEESLGVLEGFRGHDAPAGPRSAAEEIVERGAGLAGDAGFSTTPMLVKPTGSVAETLMRLAEEHDAAVVVIGTGGHGAVRSAVLGSVSREVVTDFRRPTLVV